MKKLAYLLGMGILLSFAGCDKNDDNNNSMVDFAGTLNGANEATPTGSAATGTVTGTYDMNTKILNLTITYTGLTPIAGHVHKGAVGVSGDVIFPFTSLTSPIYFTSPALDATQETDLLGGQYYVNLHTTAFQGGEIRAQLVKK